jgi:sulfide:quinone oxidoreductase
MKQVRHITDGFAVAGALAPEDFAEAAAMGFRSVLSNLPDGESRAHPPAREAAALAEREGLAFRHLPVTKAGLFEDGFVAGMASALRELPGPVLAHCLSGQRSLIGWAAATARHAPVDEVLATLKAAGIDLEPLREELEAQGRK